MYHFTKANGWEATLTKYRPAMAEKKADCTLGEYIDSAKATADLNPKTLEGYCRSIRKIASDLLGYPDDGSRYDYRGGRRAKWIAQVDQLKLSWLTPSRFAAWKKSFLAQADDDPLSQRNARISADFFLRNSRSLFSEKIRRHINVGVPNPLPFDGVHFDVRPSSKYYRTFDLGQLIRNAQEELSESDPEAFKVLLLSAMAGLRRKEIDLLTWSGFRWDEGVIRIERTRYFAPKTQDSVGDIAVDPELMTIFRGYLARGERSAEFVINSSKPPHLRITYNYYRCQDVFERLIEWLRRQGIKSAKPIHELRKAFGSAICDRAGIHQASRSLRHSDIRVTSQVYVDSRSRVSVGLGHLLAPPANITSISPNTEVNRTAVG
jgi:integrase